MRAFFFAVAGAVLLGGSVAAAEVAPDAMQAPPLVDAPPTDAPTAQPPAAGQEAPTPPPPGYVPQGTQKVPYPYSPYGQLQQTEPPAEVGLIITEALFGALTAGGTVALTGFLVLPFVATMGYPISDIILVLTLSTVPLSVAQTEQSLANGSRYYVSESWPGTLAALVGEAASVGLFYLAGGFSGFLPGTISITPSLLALIISNTVLVPALVTLAINLTKQPRTAVFGGMGALMRYDDRNGLRVGVPVPSPIAVMTPGGPALAIGATIASARF
ncbi:MAG: hypothetical protein IRZ16_21505 [Myxococcaceae bacterium]|nr:hypothetical protein [Myxococcaceae bacterium]